MRYLVGVDEAGRGPLAGPVSVGVIAVPESLDFSVFRGVRDSKQLSPQRREDWYALLSNLRNNEQIFLATALVGNKHIDMRGITHAVKTGIGRCFAKLALDPDMCEVRLDGLLRAPQQFANQRTIINGDELEPVIALASIAAKVRRDRYMRNIAKQYPVYGFEIHKGYGTKRHAEALKSHGSCEIHRTSFMRNT